MLCRRAVPQCLTRTALIEFAEAPTRIGPLNRRVMAVVHSNSVWFPVYCALTKLHSI